jgi:arylsulfatase
VQSEPSSLTGEETGKHSVVVIPTYDEADNILSLAERVLIHSADEGSKRAMRFSSVNRRTGLCVVMGSASLLLASCLIAERAAIAPEGDAATPLNVLLIVIDTLRRDHVGTYGYERDTSPHLDAFFRRGSTFLNATSPSPCTTPAVLQMLTGSRDFDDQRPRLSEVLHEKGFATAAFVSQQRFGNRENPQDPYRRGFDVFDIQGEREVDVHSMTARTAHQVTDLALAWLEARPKEAPFFLWLHYFDPHDPYESPDAYRIFPVPVPGMDGDRRIRLRAAMKHALALADDETKARILGKSNPSTHFGAIFSDGEVRTLRGYYDAEIRYTDAQIQRVIETLARTKVLDNTLVILTSDHGERLGEDNRWEHCTSLHSYEINVPLMVRHPRQAPSSQVVSAVSTLDIVPTVLSALGIDPSDFQLDGADLFDLPSDRLVHSLWHSQASVQNERWKLVLDILPGGNEWRLYDLDADPDEKMNVADVNADELIALREAMMAQAQRDSELRPRIEDTLKQLRAIGYLQ